jgi:hypothetical protein
MPVRVLDREPMPHADPGTLQDSIEALGRVDVGRGDRQRITTGELASGVVDRKMHGELGADPPVGRQIVGEERGTAIDVPIHKRCNGAFSVRAPPLRLGLPAALDSHRDLRLATSAAPFGLILGAVPLAGLVLLPALATERCTSSTSTSPLRVSQSWVIRLRIR